MYGIRRSEICKTSSATHGQATSGDFAASQEFALMLAPFIPDDDAETVDTKIGLTS